MEFFQDSRIFPRILWYFFKDLSRDSYRELFHYYLVIFLVILPRISPQISLGIPRGVILEIPLATCSGVACFFLGFYSGILQLLLWGITLGFLQRYLLWFLVILFQRLINSFLQGLLQNSTWNSITKNFFPSQTNRKPLLYRKQSLSPLRLKSKSPQLIVAVWQRRRRLRSLPDQITARSKHRKDLALNHMRPAIPMHRGRLATRRDGRLAVNSIDDVPGSPQRDRPKIMGNNEITRPRPIGCNATTEDWSPKI